MDETNRFILGFAETQSDENMASYTSKRQITKLARAFKEKKGRISCYALIILYVMFVTIVENSDNIERESKLFQQFATSIHDLIYAYYTEYKDDEVARFIIRCYSVAFEAFKNSSDLKTAEDFPGFPKRSPENVPDE